MLNFVIFDICQHYTVCFYYFETLITTVNIIKFELVPEIKFAFNDLLFFHYTL